MPYCGANPVLCRRLAEGVAPLGSPISSHQGLQRHDFLCIIIDQAQVPVAVNTGIGASDQALEALEVDADAVLVNVALTVVRDPVIMARAFRVPL